MYIHALICTYVICTCMYLYALICTYQYILHRCWPCTPRPAARLCSHICTYKPRFTTQVLAVYPEAGGPPLLEDHAPTLIVRSIAEYVDVAVAVGAYVCMHACVCMYACMCVCVCVCECTYIPVCMDLGCTKMSPATYKSIWRDFVSRFTTSVCNCTRSPGSVPSASPHPFHWILFLDFFSISPMPSRTFVIS